MVVVNKRPSTSTYFHSFQAAPRPEIAKSYVNSSDYRFERRLNECSHSVDSFVWDQPEWDSESHDSRCLPVKHSLPTHQYKHLKFNEAYRKQFNTADIEALKKLNLSSVKENGKIDFSHASTNTTAACISHRTEPCTLCQRTIAVQTADFSDHLSVCSPSLSSIHAESIINNENNSKPNEKTPTKNNPQLSSTPAAKVCAKHPDENIKGIKPKRPVSAYSTLVPRFSPKVKKAAINGSQKRPSSVPSGASRPPFAAYGYKNSGGHINKKITHNVNASSEVADAAIRAQRRLQWDINRREEIQKKKRSCIEQRQRVEQERKRRDMSVWESEYRRNFVGYNDLDYRTATPARMIVSRAGPDLQLTM